MGKVVTPFGLPRFLEHTLEEGSSTKGPTTYPLLPSSLFCSSYLEGEGHRPILSPSAFPRLQTHVTNSPSLLEAPRRLAGTTRPPRARAQDLVSVGNSAVLQSPPRAGAQDLGGLGTAAVVDK